MTGKISKRRLLGIASSISAVQMVGTVAGESSSDDASSDDPPAAVLDDKHNLAYNVSVINNSVKDRDINIMLIREDNNLKIFDRTLSLSPQNMDGGPSMKAMNISPEIPKSQNYRLKGEITGSVDESIIPLGMGKFPQYISCNIIVDPDGSLNVSWAQA